MAKQKDNDPLGELKGWRGGETETTPDDASEGEKENTPETQESPQETPPVPFSADTLEEVIRVLKTGLIHHPVVSPETRNQLGGWIKEREDEIDLAEGRDPSQRSGNLQEENTPQNEEEGTYFPQYQIDPAASTPGGEQTIGHRLSGGTYSSEGQH